MLSTPFTITPVKALSGFVAGAIGVFFQTLLPLFICVVFFEIVDFITGVWKSFVEARRKRKPFAFESIKAWRTIYKVVFILTGIVLAELIDAMICVEHLRLANFFTAFACGVEFWSFLENAAVISDHPIFKWLRKFMKKKVEGELGTDFEDEIKNKE